MYSVLRNLIDRKKEKNRTFAMGGWITLLFAVATQLINMAKLPLYYTTGHERNPETLLLVYMAVLITASIAMAGLLLLAYGYHFIYLKAAPFLGAAILCLMAGYILSGFLEQIHTVICYQSIFIVGIHILLFLLGGFRLLRKLPIALAACAALVAASGWVVVCLLEKSWPTGLDPWFVVLHLMSMALFAVFLILEGVGPVAYAIKQKKQEEEMDVIFP